VRKSQKGGFDGINSLTICRHYSNTTLEITRWGRIRASWEEVKSEKKREKWVYPEKDCISLRI